MVEHRTFCSPRLPPWVLPAAEALALLVLVAVQLRGFTNQLDLHPMDEAYYLSQGRAVLRGEWQHLSPGWSPLSALAYALLLLLPLGDTLAPDAMLCAVSATSTLGAWWMLRGFVPPWAAVCGACWWALSPALLQHHQVIAASPYAFNATLCFAAVGALQRGHQVLPALLLGLAAVNRGELAPWLVVAGAVVLARGSGSARRFGLLVGGLGAVVLAVQLLAPDCRDRSWLAFRFGYGVMLDAGRPPAEQTATMFVDEDLVARTFPGATSPVSAAWSAPVAFLAHIGRVLARLPPTLWMVAEGPLHSPLLDHGVQAVALAVLVWGALRMRSRWRRALGAIRAPVRWLVASSPLALVGALVTMPVFYYALPIWAPLAILMLVPLAATLSGVRASVLRWIPWSRVLVPALPLVVALVVPPHSPAVPGVHRETREAAHVLRRANLAPGARLWARNAPGLLSIVGREDIQCLDLFPFERPGTAPETLRRMLAERPPDYVLFTVLAGYGPAGVPLQSELAMEHWLVVDVSPGLLAVLYRRAP